MTTPLPTDFFPGYSSDGTSITIPLTAFGGSLTAAEADELTGDGRKVAFELTKAIADRFTAIPTANRPARMNATIGTLQGVSQTVARRAYTLSYDLDVAAADVAPEA